MDVIGNNISNVNTAAFKTSRVIFQDIYSQTSRNASSATTTVGGTNPIQIGLGVTLATIDVLHTSAATQRTDNPTDLAIEGDGFFIIKGSAPENLYTRAGNLYIDAAGNLVTADGSYIQGLMGSGNFTTVITDPVTGNKTAWLPPDPADYAAGGVDGMVNTANMGNINLNGWKSVAIDDKGVITGLDAAGNKQTIGIIPIATFLNPSGLEKKGSSQYAASSNSGAAQVSTAQTNGAGKINVGGLEMSNVDLAAEFTDMIVTQRGFQANSRIITTSDSLLEELINLKR
jgi:flagellar hook protein FlgE